MTAEEWKAIIADALLIEADTIPAADGSTPLTNTVADLLSPTIRY